MTDCRKTDPPCRKITLLLAKVDAHLSRRIGVETFLIAPGLCTFRVLRCLIGEATEQ
jgi:hypothetical protein